MATYARKIFVGVFVLQFVSSASTPTACFPGSPNNCKSQPIAISGYSAGKLLKITNGIRVSKSTQQDSCPNGWKVWSPRSKEDWTAVYNTLRSIDNYPAKPHLIIDITRDQDGCGGCAQYAMNSEVGQQSSWKTSDGSKWWLRDTKFREPNGDYTANCYLGVYSVDPNNVQFNDQKCAYSSTDYLCQPELGATTETPTTRSKQDRLRNWVNQGLGLLKDTIFGGDDGKDDVVVVHGRRLAVPVITLADMPDGPCVMVDCQPGFSVFGQDDRGCGGHCIKMSTSQLKSARAVFAAQDINGDGSIPKGAAYSALVQVASQWHMSPTEKQLDGYSNTAGKTVALPAFLKMCISMVKASKPANCEDCVAANGAWTPATSKCTFNSHYRGYGDMQYSTRQHCAKDAAAQRAGCGRYKNCHACVQNGMDSTFGALCAWIDADAPLLMGGRALSLASSGKCQPASIAFHFGGHMEMTKLSQCTVSVHD